MASQGRFRLDIEYWIKKKKITEKRVVQLVAPPEASAMETFQRHLGVSLRTIMVALCWCLDWMILKASPTLRIL